MADGSRQICSTGHFPSVTATDSHRSCKLPDETKPQAGKSPQILCQGSPPDRRLYVWPVFALLAILQLNENSLNKIKVALADRSCGMHEGPAGRIRRAGVTAEPDCAGSAGAARMRR